MSWYYSRAGQSKGPVEDPEFDRLVATGEIAPLDLVWRDGMPGWLPLAEVRPAPVAAASEPAATAVCQACQRTFPADLVVPVAGALVCADCKSRQLQKLRETGTGIPAPGVTEGPRGVGGWLLFFCIGLTILGPLASIASMFGQWNAAAPAFDRMPGLRTVMLVESVGMSILVLVVFVVGILIWSGRPDGRTLARKLLIGRVVWVVLVEGVALFLLRDASSAAFAGAIGAVTGVLFRELIYFAVWWRYFKKSVRVANTYGPED